MTPQEALGWIMVVGPALALTVAAWRVSGPLVIAAVLLITAAATVWVAATAYLLGAI